VDTGEPSWLTKRVTVEGEIDMRGSKHDLPAALELDEGKVWQQEWGDLTVEIGDFSGRLDPGPYFKGLPDDQCQCPHWGYVIKGQLRYIFADREEVYGPGDIYYVPPGHRPIIEAGTEWVEFSPKERLAETMAVVERNFVAAQQAASA
jgi:hypothetical protein